LVLGGTNEDVLAGADQPVGVVEAPAGPRPPVPGTAEPAEPVDSEAVDLSPAAAAESASGIAPADDVSVESDTAGAQSAGTADEPGTAPVVPAQTHPAGGPTTGPTGGPSVNDPAVTPSGDGSTDEPPAPGEAPGDEPGDEPSVDTPGSQPPGVAPPDPAPSGPTDPTAEQPVSAPPAPEPPGPAPAPLPGPGAGPAPSPGPGAGPTPAPGHGAGSDEQTGHGPIADGPSTEPATDEPPDQADEQPVDDESDPGDTTDTPETGGSGSALIPVEVTEPDHARAFWTVTFDVEGTPDLVELLDADADADGGPYAGHAKVRAFTWADGLLEVTINMPPGQGAEWVRLRLGADGPSTQAFPVGTEKETGASDEAGERSSGAPGQQ
jgi:hypothetical protein